MGRLLPQYDPARRRLTWGGHTLKQLCRPAETLELVFRVLEEEGWPEFCDDPLPPRNGVDPKVRLHNVISNANRRLQSELFRFKGDGTGTRVGWELCVWFSVHRHHIDTSKHLDASIAAH
jgi:hypothetical protein